MNKNKHVNFCIVLLQVIKTEYPAVFKEKIGNKGMVKWDKQKHNIPIRFNCAAAVYCLGDKFDQYQISTPQPAEGQILAIHDTERKKRLLLNCSAGMVISFLVSKCLD